MISVSSIVLLGVATLLLSFFFRRRNKSWENFPPGPPGLPVLGNFLEIGPCPHVPYAKWANEFGPIVGVTIGTTRIVIVSDHKMVKEMFAEPAFSGRMEGFRTFDVVTDGKLHGIVNTEGGHWEEIRRFTLRQLRDFGFGRNTMEESIMMEVNEFIDILKEDVESPIPDITDKLFLAVVNSLWSIVAGTRHKQTDRALVEQTKKTNGVFNNILQTGGALIMVPVLAKIAPNLSGYTQLRAAMDGFTPYFQTRILEHKKTVDETYDRDFIDAYLKEAKRTKDPSSAFYGALGDDNLLGLLVDLHFAGTDTTSTTLTWMILYLSKFPDVQRKFQNEIEAITGNTRQCRVSDRPSMPYTEALLSEVLRFSSITPFGIQHRATKEQEFRGYTIPKGTVLIANLHYIHHDPRVWGDPENFRPERFLNSEGTSCLKHDALMPFSTGRRQCIGKSLAKDSLFLFATNLFQRFLIEVDRDSGFESTVALFVLSPKPFNVILKDRLT